MANRTAWTLNCLYSANRRNSLCLHWDGNVILYGGEITSSVSAWQAGVPVVWNALTNAPSNARHPLFLCMEPNGNLIGTDSNEVVFWETRTGKSGVSGVFRAVVTDDGVVQVQDAAKNVLWDSSQLKSPAPTGEAIRCQYYQ